VLGADFEPIATPVRAKAGIPTANQHAMYPSRNAATRPLDPRATRAVGRRTVGTIMTRLIAAHMKAKPIGS